MSGGPPDRLTAVALRAVDADPAPHPLRRLELLLPDGSRRGYGVGRRAAGRARGARLGVPAPARALAAPRARRGIPGREWQTPDLVGLLELFADNYAPIAGEGALGALARLRGLVPRPRLPHGLHASRQDVQAHYDLSNEFFELWLDPSLTYSCAVFETPDQSLEDAQQHKYGCSATGSRSAPSTICSRSARGWGGMAIHAARERGCRVTTTTISRAQHELASQRVVEAGLSDRVRGARARLPQLTGRYDRIVSIEMLEAIGHDQLPTTSARSTGCSRRAASSRCIGFLGIPLSFIAYHWTPADELGELERLDYVASLQVPEAERRVVV